MPTIRVQVRGKIATNLAPEVELVCGNEDYEVEFDFDESWAGVNFKTGLFIRNGELIAKPFDGNVCPVPRIDNATLLAVGVKSSDGRLFTTTPAYVNCLKSASDLATNKIPAPTQDVYDEIIALINKYIGQGGSSGIDEEAVKKLIEEETADLVAESDRDEFVKGGLTEPEETWTDEDKAKACETIGALKPILPLVSGVWLIGINKDGTISNIKMGSGASSNNVPISNSKGNIKTNTPEDPKDCTNKDYVDDKADALSAEIAVINLALEQSGLLKKYKQPIEQEYNERVTADGANVLDGSKAVLKKVVGNTVACKNLIPYPYVVLEGAYSGLTYKANVDGSFLLKGKALNAQSITLSSIELLPNTYYFKNNRNGNGAYAFIKRANGTMISSDQSFVVEGKETVTFGVYTGYENEVDYIVCPMLSVENIAWQPYFTGLKSASFGGIESTNADGTESSTLNFPKTETPLGVTIDFENKKITDYGVDLVLNGTESWYYYEYGKYQSVSGYDWGIPIGNKAVADYVSTDSEKTGNGYDSGNMWCGYNGTTGFFWLGILAKLGYLEKGTTPTIEEKNEAMTKFKAWLAERYASGNPVTVRYLARDLQSESDFTADNEYTAYKGGTEEVLENDGKEYGADNTLTQNYILVAEVK